MTSYVIQKAPSITWTLSFRQGFWGKYSLPFCHNSVIYIQKVRNLSKYKTQHQILKMVHLILCEPVPIKKNRANCYNSTLQKRHNHRCVQI